MGEFTDVDASRRELHGSVEIARCDDDPFTVGSAAMGAPSRGAITHVREQPGKVRNLLRDQMHDVACPSSGPMGRNWQIE